ncbi:MAG: ATP-binding protein [Deltaproteobacteria bacterium]|nr:ATP-binding protein [Deltaproteobacteria bacterium]
MKRIFSIKLSVRSRLTAWYVALLTISLVSFGAAFFYAISTVFVSRTDAQISAVAEMMPHAIVLPSGQLNVPKRFDVILERFFGVKTSGNFIQILDSKGDIVARGSTLEGFNIPVSDETYSNAVKGKETYETIKPFGVYPIRVFSKPVMLEERGLVAIVQVGASLEGMEAVFHYMFYFFAVGIVVSVAIAAIVGAFLARKALEPVKELTLVARRITAENLKNRIDVKTPDDEMGRLASTFNGMITRLDRSFRQIKQFTADASHELKTPLTVMKGELEIALRGRLSNEEMQEVLKSTLEEVDRMSGIVQNLLTLARTDVESGSRRMTAVRVDELLAEKFEQTKKLAAEKGVKLEIEKAAYVLVFADVIRLGQVIYNLIDNAIKYTDKGGVVSISLTEEAGSAVLRVKDTGMGISKEHLPYIFDRFYRVDKARTGGAGGVGLGLSICKEMVESFDGTIGAESEEGKGTTFTVRIPLAVAIER